MQMLEQVFPGTLAAGDQLDERVRVSIKRAAQEAEEEFVEALAAPVQVDLVEHWRRLGGNYPD